MSALRPFAVAIGFLTRVPVRTGAIQDAERARSITCFPVVGLALGLVLAGAERLAHGRLSLNLIAVGLVGLLAGLTGGLHLDGLADVFDGLGGGRGDRERMLTIMRDSRIGSHGAAALTLLLTGKVIAVAEVLRYGAVWPLVTCFVAARWAVIPLVVFFPYARSEGLGKAFNGHVRLSHFIGATCLAAACIGWVGCASIAPTASALAVVLALGAWAHRRLGGLTGDVYGAAIELAELAFLVAAGRVV
ncbi:MAG: adenosylcobinamide-GDP ribazoletransferase [Pseudomonadota bacterium]